MQGGDAGAADELLPLVYDQLHAMVGGILRGQRAQHTLQPTALLHEAYLKLVRTDGTWVTKGHFCAVASMAMRQSLSNHARDQRAAKRDGKLVDVTVSGVPTPTGESEVDWLALDEALTKRETLNPRHARMVELRFFGGLTIEEASNSECRCGRSRMIGEPCALGLASNSVVTLGRSSRERRPAVRARHGVVR